MRGSILNYAGAVALGLTLALLVHTVNHPAPPQLDYMAPKCSFLQSDGSWYVVGVVREVGSFHFVDHASVLIAAGSSVQYLRADDLGAWSVTVPADKYGVARVQVLEVLVPSEDGKLVSGSGVMPSITCRPDADDGDDQ